MSCAGFSTSAETRQSGSPIKTTCERVRPTDEMRPTRPSAVSTGRLLVRPSRLPRSICTVRHQLAGSRMTTLASFNFHGGCCCQPTSARSWSFSRAVAAVCNCWTFKPLIFALEIFNLLEQFAAGQNGVGGGDGQLLRGVGEAEQRQKQTADGEFETGRSRAAAGSRPALSPAPPRRARDNFFV